MSARVYLDLRPSARQRVVLRSLAAGLSLVLGPADGHPMIRQTCEPVLRATVDAFAAQAMDRPPCRLVPLRSARLAHCARQARALALAGRN